MYLLKNQSSMDTDLSNSVALVTGAGRGNGKMIAEALAEEGAAVAVNDIDGDKAAETVTSIETEGSDAVAVEADISDISAVEEMVSQIVEELGPIDILVNNAGIGGSNAFLQKSDNSTFRKLLDVHLYGSINCIDAVVDSMVERGYGKIINITSIHTKNGVGMSAEYDVAKFGLLGLTKSLALELGREGVRVNAVAPGWANTRMVDKYNDRTVEQILDLNPLGRFAEPAEIADSVVFLASPASDYINGHELRIDGGQQPIDCWKYNK